MPARFRITDIEHFSERNIFFDTNILLYLFWPIQPYWETRYESVYNVLLKNNCSMYIDFTVISEFVNKAISIEYGIYLAINKLDRQSFTYKRFRNSVDGQQCIADVYSLVKTIILYDFQITGKYFDEKDINQFLSLNQLDFSDKAIESLCQEHGFVLLTNDRDFQNSNIDILSENKKLV
jgi:predicted nucleic acid-binding protein